MNDKQSFTLDFTNVDQDDDGETITYSGHYVLDGEKHQATGSDMSWSYRDMIGEHIAFECKTKLGVAMDDDILNTLDMALTEIDTQSGLGTVTVTYADAQLHVSYNIE